MSKVETTPLEVFVSKTKKEALAIKAAIKSKNSVSKTKKEALAIKAAIKSKNSVELNDRFNTIKAAIKSKNSVSKTKKEALAIKAAIKSKNSVELNDRFNTIKENKDTIKELRVNNNILTIEIINLVLIDLASLKLEYSNTTKKVLLNTLKARYDSKDGGLFALVCESMANGLTIDYNVSLSTYRYINKLIRDNRISNTKAKSINAENYSDILAPFKKEDKIKLAKAIIG